MDFSAFDSSETNSCHINMFENSFTDYRNCGYDAKTYILNLKCSVKC